MNISQILHYTLFLSIGFIVGFFLNPGVYWFYGFSLIIAIELVQAEAKAFKNDYYDLYEFVNHFRLKDTTYDIIAGIVGILFAYLTHIS